MRRDSTRSDAVLRAPHPIGLVAALAFAGLSSSFTMTIVLPIQAQLPALLNASRDDTAWVVTITLLTSAAATPIAGKLGDMYGKRRMILVLLGIQLFGSVIGGLSDDVVWLIIGRGLQGFAMGVIPIGIAVMRDLLTPSRLGTAIGVMSATLGVGAAVGLPLGGFVTHALDWHMLFWLSAAIALIGFWLVRSLVPASGSRAPGRLDVLGSIGMAAGVSAILVAVTRGNDWGWLAPPTVGLFAAGITVLAIWVWWELRVSNPVVDLRVAARAPVLLTNLTSSVLAFAVYSGNIIYPQLLEIPAESGYGLGLNLFAVGMVMLPHALAMTILSPVGGRLMTIIGPRAILIISSALTLAGFIVSLVAPLTVWTILIVVIIYGGAAGLGYSSMPVLIMRAVPITETGAANGFNALMRSMGNSVSAAVVGAILANSVVDVGGIDVPNADGFRLAFVIGIIAAGAAIAIALAIPRAISGPIREVPIEASTSAPTT